MRDLGIPVALVSARTRDGVVLAGVMAEPRRRRRTALIWVHGLGSTFANGYDLGAILPAGLSLTTLGSDLILRYSVSGGGNEQQAALVPEPNGFPGATVAAAAAMGLTARRRRRGERVVIG